MRTLVTIICLIIGIAAEAQHTNEYSAFVKNFCERKQGKWVTVDGMHACAQLPHRIMQLTNTKSERRCVITDSTNHLAKTVQIGDYIYFNKWLNEKAYNDGYTEVRYGIQSHFAVVIGIDTENETMTIADQNIPNIKGVNISTFSYRTKFGGIEVYKLVKGKLDTYNDYFMRPR